jgi:metal-responsive CopG/Arc/MetJ family transcriptional regulator
MKTNKKFLRKDKSSQSRRPDLITALEAITARENIHLEVAIPNEIAEKLDHFLKEKGLTEREGILILFEHGLSEEGERELAKLESEMRLQISDLSGKYATKKFLAHEYFIENKEITLRLRFLLSENRFLKERMKKEGLQTHVPKDEWDNWDEPVIRDYYRKYVFTSRL